MHGYGMESLQPYLRSKANVVMYITCLLNGYERFLWKLYRSYTDATCPFAIRKRKYLRYVTPGLTGFDYTSILAKSPDSAKPNCIESWSMCVLVP
jgi:hypothetical protein